jgi:hypothetical protein
MRTARLFIPLDTIENISATGIGEGEIVRDETGTIHMDAFKITPELSSDYVTEDDTPVTIATATIPEQTAGTITIRAVGSDGTDMVVIQKVYPFLKTDVLTIKSATTLMFFADAALEDAGIAAIDSSENISIELTGTASLINWSVAYSTTSIALPDLS